MKYLTPVLILFSMISFSCAKQKVSIGREQPDIEIQKCTKLMADKDFDEAVQCYEMFKSRFPQSPLAEEAELKIADAYFDKKEYLLAVESYTAFLKFYPNHPKSDYAHYKIGKAYMKEAPKAIDRDQQYLETAAGEFEIVVRRYPNGQYFDAAAEELFEAIKRLAHRHFYVGRFYFRTDEYIACLPRFYEIVENYPTSGLVDRSLYMITVANIELGRIDDAREAFSKLSMDFPESKWKKRAEKRMQEATK